MGQRQATNFKYVVVKVKIGRVVVSLRRKRNIKTLVYKRRARGFGHESYGKERGRNKEARTMKGNNFHPLGLVQIFLH